MLWVVLWRDTEDKEPVPSLWSTVSEDFSTANSHVGWFKISAALNIILLAALWEALNQRKS